LSLYTIIHTTGWAKKTAHLLFLNRLCYNLCRWSCFVRFECDT